MMRKFLSLVGLAVGLSLAQLGWAQTATLLPNAEQQFADGNGVPYANGSVYFYIPNTLTPKTTWSNATETTPNPNPVVLDGAGRAIIYGAGQYRQILKDQFGNTVWDQLTQDVYGLVISSLGAVPSNFGTIANLRANTKILSAATVGGYSSINGVGGGYFIVGASAADNSCTIFNDTVGQSWYRVGATGAPVNIQWCGAAPDATGATGAGTDDTAAINAAMSLAATKNTNIEVPIGWYRVGNSAGLTKVTLAQFTRGFGIIGENFVRSYIGVVTPGADSRIVWDAAPNQILVDIESSVPTGDSWSSVLFKNVGFEVTSSVFQNGTLVKVAGMAAYRDNACALHGGVGWAFSVADGMQGTNSCAIFNGAAGETHDKIFNDVEVNGYWYGNSNQTYGAHAPYVGAGVIIGPTNSSDNHVYINPVFLQETGIVADNLNGLTIIGGDFESNSDGTGNPFPAQTGGPLRLGLTAQVTNVTINGIQDQSQGSIFGHVSGWKTDRTDSLIYHTIGQTMGGCQVSQSQTPNSTTAVHVLDSSYANDCRSAELVVDGDLSMAAATGSVANGIPSPLVVAAGGSGTFSVTQSNGGLAGRTYYTITASGCGASPCAQFTWANKAGYMGLAAGDYLYSFVVGQNGTAGPGTSVSFNLTCQNAAINTVGPFQLNSAAGGVAIGTSWTFFPVQFQIPTTGGCVNITAVQPVFSIGSAGTWFVQQFSLSPNPQPTLLSRTGEYQSFSYALGGSATTTITNLANSGYNFFVSGYGAAGNTCAISTSGTSLVVTNLSASSNTCRVLMVPDLTSNVGPP